jgi:hypothetical protein
MERLQNFLKTTNRSTTSSSSSPPLSTTPLFPEKENEPISSILRKRKETPSLPAAVVQSQAKRQKRVEISSSTDPPMNPNISIFSPNPESATTAVFLAPSFSGKTTLLVNELNKLTEDELNAYAGIMLITPNTSAHPLKALKPTVLQRLNIFDLFIPELLGFMKKTNNAASHRFRYLVILDDCLRLRGDTIVNMILTLRNSGVSTVLSIQYSRLLTPGQRQSVHDYYFINLQLEDLEYILGNFIQTHVRDLLHSEGDANAYTYTLKKLTLATRERLKGKKILHYDQRHDTIKIYSR